MPDRTSYHLILPATTTPGVLAVAVAAFTRDTWTTAEIEDTHAQAATAGAIRIDVHERYEGQARQTAADVAHALHTYGADIPFTISEEPGFYLGTLVRYDPDHGFHEAPSDGTHALLTDERFTALAATAGTAAELVERIRAELGSDWAAPVLS